MSHNDLRDAEARLLKQVCGDVKVEPELLPTDFVGNVAEEARSDISKRSMELLPENLYGLEHEKDSQTTS